ncbi:MAG: hypothetical protein JO044_10805 [Mycobacteriaceae bacterium]|nr:hypothetical protein [Mycobacteriaceae bacterium]
MRRGDPVIAALLVLAGCAHTTSGQSRPAPATLTTPPSSAVQSAPAPPGPDTPIADLIAWIQAGDPADAGAFHTATRDGVTSRLGGDVAFVTPSGKTNCMTDSKYSGGALACLVKLTDPPPRPPDAYTEWIGGWVDFDGASITVGGLHGDPGRFTAGDGPQLPYGSSLKFGDYQCRSDQVGLYCVDYAHRSAARFSDTGIVAFGCARQATPPPDVGEKFVC